MEESAEDKSNIFALFLIRVLFPYDNFGKSSFAWVEKWWFIQVETSQESWMMPGNPPSPPFYVSPPQVILKMLNGKWSVWAILPHNIHVFFHKIFEETRNSFYLFSFQFHWSSVVLRLCVDLVATGLETHSSHSCFQLTLFTVWKWLKIYQYCIETTRSCHIVD